MRKMLITVTALALTAGLAAAADSPIVARKALMDSNAAAAGMAGAMMKGDMAYSPAAGKSAIETLRATAHAYGAFFPEDSKTGDNTHASPKIWTDRAGFDKAITKFRDDAEAAAKTSGKHGPSDLAAFKSAILPVLGNCKSCHEDYRVRN